MQSVANGFVEQHSGHCGIYAATQTKHNFSAADLRLEGGHRLVNKAVGCPRRSASRDFIDEVAEQLGSVLRMHHFGVELNRVRILALKAERGHGNAVRRRLNHGVGRQSYNAVAVAHPHGASGRNSGQKA